MLADQQMEQALHERVIRRQEQRGRESRGLVAPPAGDRTAPVRPCPAWAHALDGRLSGIPHEERMYGPGFPGHEPGLAPIRVTIASGKPVFGCLSRKTPPFQEWTAPLLPRYERYGIHAFKRYRREPDETYPIGWKAFAENPNDDHHVRLAHHRLNEARGQMDTIVRFEGRTAGGCTPHADDFEVSAGRTAPPREDLRGRRTECVYPNLTPPPYASQLIMVRVDPIAPDRSRLFSRTYGLSDDVELQTANSTTRR